MSVATRIKNRRITLDVTQTQLAKKAKTTQAVISRVENMSSNPSINLLKRIASAFNTHLRIAFD